IMMGLEFTGQAPFHTVYLHGTVRDTFGRRMSKTLGNGIDPLWILDGAAVDQLPDYARAQYPKGLPAMGADALRFTLLTGSTPGKDLNLNLEAVEANRNFANKLWNAGRLVLMGIDRAPARADSESAPTLADRWIRSRQGRIVREVNRLFEAYQFGEAGRQIYEFLWGEFADWYLEIAKRQLEEGGGRARLTARTMVDALDTVLRLLHPYTPYVTEELWGHLKAGCLGHTPGFAPQGGWEEALILGRWPVAEHAPADDREAETEFEVVRQVIGAIRNARAEKGVEPRRKIAAVVRAGEHERLLREQTEVIASLAGVDPANLVFASEIDQPPAQAVPLVVGTVEIFLPLTGMLDTDEERARLNRELEAAEGQIRRLEGLLAGPFAERAPAEVVEKERTRLADLRQARDRLRTQLERIA
ncbi:MAG: class I tRNA ligase family protein, partial [Anaerolineales bacterium]